MLWQASPVDAAIFASYAKFFRKETETRLRLCYRKRQMHTLKSMTISRHPSPVSNRYTTAILSQLLLCSCYVGRGQGNQDVREKLLKQESDDGHGLHPIEFYVRPRFRVRQVPHRNVWFPLASIHGRSQGSQPPVVSQPPCPR